MYRSPSYLREDVASGTGGWICNEFVCCGVIDKDGGLNN